MALYKYAESRVYPTPIPHQVSRIRRGGSRARYQAWGAVDTPSECSERASTVRHESGERSEFHIVKISNGLFLFSLLLLCSKLFKVVQSCSRLFKVFSTSAQQTRDSERPLALLLLLRL